MSTVQQRRWQAFGSSTRVAVAAWAGLPVIIVVYSLLRWGATGPMALALAQLVFLLAPVLATTFCASTAWAAPPRSRPRTLCALTAFAALFLLIGEVYTSWHQLTGRDLPAGLSIIGDGVNALGLLCVVALLAVLARADRIGWAGTLRVALDIAVVCSLAFALIMRTMLSGPLGNQSPEQAVQMSLYALGGVLILALDGFVVLRLESPRRGPWVLILNIAIAVFGLAMLLWPLWRLAITGVEPAPIIEIVTTNMFLAGYYLVFLAALMKLISPDASAARLGGEMREISLPWVPVTISVIVFFAVGALGYLALNEPAGSVERVAYIVVLIVATTCLVARTALAGIEQRRLLERGTIDPVTGVANPRGFDGRVGEYLAAMRRFGEPFGLVIVDVDDFGRVSGSLSLSEGDRLVAEIAGSLRAAVAPDGHTFRIASDGFAVLAAVETRGELERLAETARAAVARVGTDAQRLTASVGYAMAPDDALNRDALVRRTEAALAWAKRHGKNRVVGYDARIGRALRAEDARTPDSDARLGVARALSAAADARDPSEFLHARNVAALSRLLGEDMGFDDETLERLHLAAQLHDVGKIALPEPRSGSRRGVIDPGMHAEVGERLVRPLEIPDVAIWVRSHHERWDGQGGPDGLVGGAIPVESRIIALADAYDRMTNGSRSGEPLSKAAALQEIDQGMGSRFDPVLAERFIYTVASLGAMGWSDAEVAS